MSAAATQSRKDLVLGLGATGLSIARYLKRHELDATFYDTRESPPGLDALKALYPEADVLLGDVKLPKRIARVIASPGIADTHALLTAARKAGLEVVSDIELFAREAGAPFVAVTGSNGKSTVTTLLYHMCSAAGLDVYAGGNLGEPALDLLDRAPPDIYVLELSSFQLQRTAKLPAAVSVLLNISPDHLDWHTDIDEYRRSKYRVFREARAAVYNRADPDVFRHVKHLKRTLSFGLDAPAPGHYGIRQENGETYLARGETLLLSVRELALFGRHNQANALAALAAGELAGLDLPAMISVLCEFPGLAHRMQFVARLDGVTYINDSKATNVAAAAASIDSIDGRIVLIAGGVGKGADFKELAAAVDGKLRAAVLIGEDAEAIEAALDTLTPIYFAPDMDEAVRQAAAHAERDDTVLLAPACASFDQFKNFEARGDAFAAAVARLGR